MTFEAVIKSWYRFAESKGEFQRSSYGVLLNVIVEPFVKWSDDGSIFNLYLDGILSVYIYVLELFSHKFWWWFTNYLSLINIYNYDDNDLK